MPNERSEHDFAGAQTAGDGAIEAVAEIARRFLGCEAVSVYVTGDAASSAVALAPGQSIVAKVAADPRTLTDPVAASDLGLGFYAGIPLRAASGSTLGVLAAVDADPRELDEDELQTFKLAARVLIALIERANVGAAAAG